MRGTSFNSMRGKIARTVNAIVYDHIVRHYDTLPTQRQIKEIMRYAKRGFLDGMYEAYQDLLTREE